MAQGKYKKLIDQLQLPRHLGTEPEYQQKIDALKNEINRPGTEDEPLPAEWQEIEPLVKAIGTAITEVNNLLMRAADGKKQVSAYARGWRMARAVKKAYEEQEYELNMVLEAYRQLIINQFELEDISSVRLASGELVYATWEPRVKVIDRDKLRAWVMAIGLERELQIPWQTLNSLSKERFLRGELEADGVELESDVKLTLRQS